MRKCFDSVDLEVEEQFSGWCHAVAGTFYPLDAEQSGVSGASGFAASLSRMSLGALDLMEIRSGAMRTRRSLARPRDEHRSHLFISFMLNGAAHLEEPERQVTQQAGDVVVWYGDETAKWEIVQHVHSLVLHVPLRLTGCRARRLDTLSAGTLKDETSMARLAGRVMSEAACLKTTEAASAAFERVGLSILDIVTSGLEIQADASGAQRPAARQDQALQRAKTYLGSQLDNAEVTVAAAARALNVSIRTFNRLFKAEGESAMRWLWRQRLEHARQMISGRATHRVADVALACGFTSLPHFSHAFRRAYALSPSEMFALSRAASGLRC